MKESFLRATKCINSRPMTATISVFFRSKALSESPPSERILVVELAEKTITAPKASRISVAVSSRLYSTEVGAFSRFTRPFGAGRCPLGRRTVFLRRSGIDSAHDLPEPLPALFVIGELVETGAGRREQHGLAEQDAP